MSTPTGAGARPELSVIIPAYDAEATLGVQLGALLAQRPAWPWEVIVSDNGSSDGTRRLVAEWSERMPELRLVDASARRGPSAARNIAVAQARSEALAFCDADDMVADGWVEAVHRALSEHEFVAGPFEGARLNAGLTSAVSWTAQTDRLTVKPGLEQFVTAGSGNMGVRTAVFDEVGGSTRGPGPPRTTTSASACSSRGTTWSSTATSCCTSGAVTGCGTSPGSPSRTARASGG